MRYLLPLIVLCGLPWLIPAMESPPALPTLDGEALRAQLVLHQALPKSPHGDQQLPTSPTAWLSLERQAGTWLPVIATAADYSQHEHRGWILDWQVNGDELRATVQLTLRGDGWTAGGTAILRIQAQRDDHGQLEGRYEGDVHSNRHFPVSGRVSGSLWPVPQNDAGKPGLREHPRLLFRAADLPVIRERAASPLGQAALVQMEDSIAGLAFRHALSGDAELAAEVRRRLDLLMADNAHGQNNVLSRLYAWRLEQAALAFDLCYHAWDPEYRARVADYMRTNMEILLHGRGTLTNRIRWGHAGPHAPALFYATGIAALAIADEPGPAPVSPQAPALIGPSGGRVPGIAGYEVPEGVPQHDFASGVMPDKWIYVGPFPEHAIPASSLTERAALRPRPGDTLGEGEQQSAWRAVEPDKLIYSGRHSGNQPRLLLTGPSGVKTHTNSYYFSILNNDVARWVRVRLGHSGVEMVLSGVALREGDIIHLQAGRHPWLLTGPLGHMNPWAKSFAEPRLDEVGADEVDHMRQQSEAQHLVRLAEWERMRALHQATDGAHLEGLMLSRTATHIMDMVMREMLGDGGMISGGDRLVGLDGTNKYAFIHQRVRGMPPGARNEAALSLIRSAFVHPYAADRSVRNQEVNGLSGFITAAYPEGGRDLANEHFATMFPLLPERWQPAALWLWQYHSGGHLRDAEGIRALVTPAGRNYPFSRPYGHFHTHPLFVLMNYPATMTAQQPQGHLPLTWAAPDKGFYGFRNQWQNQPNTFITQVFSASPEEASGSLRLFGFGQVWSHGLDATPPGLRFAENVVQITDHDLRLDARAKVLHLEQGHDGSGSMVLDLGPVYQRMVRTARGRPVGAEEAYSGIPRAGASLESGISGQRAIAVDYSGTSGVPALLVISDVLSGVADTRWSWILDAQRRGLKPQEIDQTVPGRDGRLTQALLTDAEIGALMHEETEEVNDPRITLHADGFSLHQGGASLRATFVGEQQPTVRLVRRRSFSKVNVEIIRIDESLGLEAAGSDQYLVVLTVQQGEAPAVQRLGADHLQIGAQHIHLRDGRVVIGAQP